MAEQWSFPYCTVQKCREDCQDYEFLVCVSMAIVWARSELVSQGPKHFLARRENLGGLYKGGRQIMWIPKAWKEFVTECKPNFSNPNKIMELQRKKAKPRASLLNLAWEGKWPRSDLNGNDLCGLSLERKWKQARVWWGEDEFSMYDSNWQLCRESLMNKCAQSWGMFSVSSSGVDSQLVGIKWIYIGRGLETYFSQEQDQWILLLFCGALAFNSLFS